MTSDLLTTGTGSPDRSTAAPRDGLPQRAVGGATESTRVLLDLLDLSRRFTASEKWGPEDGLSGVIPRDALKCLLSALHLRDPATVRHSRRAAILAVGMGERLGWEAQQLKMLEIAALLHDVGKIGVPDHILFKPGKLSADETELMALHHDVGVDVLQACGADQEVLTIITQSHQHYDGATCGFERVGSNVHQGARILAVADAYDSLSTPQTYRPAQKHADIMATLMNEAGTRFDGNVVCALSRWVQADGLPFDHMPETVPQSEPTGREAVHAETLFRVFSYLYVLESLYDGFYVADAELRFTVWNRGLERLLGHTGHSMLGRTWTGTLLEHSLPDGRVLPEAKCPVHRAVSTKLPATTTVRLKRTDGKWADVEVQSVPVIDRNGKVCGAAEIYRDLSRTSRRPQEFRELKLAASRDPLTNVANRGEMETQLTLLVGEYAHAADPAAFSVIFLDLDHFKSINDDYDHATGDAVLKMTAKLLQNETFSGELVGRYGGEEFVIICPDTDLAQAEKKADRLRQVLMRSEFAPLGGRKVTASFGVSEMEPGDSVASLLGRADRALYLSKGRGRNRVTALRGGQHEEDTLPEDENTDPFVLEVTLLVGGSAEMIVYKLGGFVDDEAGAKLLRVEPHRAVLRLGSRSLLGVWGSRSDRQPVEITVCVNTDAHTDGRSHGHHRNRVPARVRIEPIGRVRDADTFQKRAKHVLRILRSYLAAE
jgi:diguanylate cyclase (GGDEF)-like protein/PAS domain S-box-containing protein/putative nucleotidyltransferase with HDIG domain